MSETVRFSSPIAYEGNLFFLILALIFWLPLGLLLLMRYGYFVHKASRFHFKYRACCGFS